MRIQSKILVPQLVAFGAFLLFLVILVADFGRQQRHLGDAVDRLTHIITLAQEVQRLHKERLAAVTHYYYRREPRTRTAIASNKLALEDVLRNLRSRLVNERAIELYQGFHRCYLQASQTEDAMLAAIDSGRTDQLEGYFRRLEFQEVFSHARFSDFLGFNNVRVKMRLAALEQSNQRALFLLILQICLTVVATGAIIIIYRRTLIRPIEALVAAVQRAKAGDWNQKFENHDQDEVGELSRLFASFLRTLKATKRDLETEQVRAERANAAKSRFLAAMSHEIRTPLTAIIGYTDLLQGGAEDRQEARKWMDRISANSKHLLALVNDVLDFSKIEADELEIEPDRVVLRPLVEDVVDGLRGMAEAKQLKLEWSVADDVPAEVVLDPLRLRQILINLLTNAVKFTRQGEVQLTLSMSESGDLLFSVRDTGPGIPISDQERVFLPFQQGKGRAGGTGLGLSISRALARRMGGALSLSSVPGEGSTFRLRIPALKPAPVTPPAGASRGGTGTLVLDHRRVVLAEDIRDTREALATILRSERLEVWEAGNGKEACEAVRRSDPDIVLLDLDMPEMDGFEAATRLRQGGFRKPIIAVTAHAVVPELRRALEAGCTRYLTKPLDRARLIETIRTELGHGGEVSEGFSAVQ